MSSGRRWLKPATAGLVLALALPFMVWVPANADVAASTHALIHMSSSTGGSVGGVSFADEDIVVYDTIADSWTKFFDGSDVGLGGTDVNGFHIVAPEDPLSTILFTTQNPVTLADVGSVDDSDIVEFTPSSLGTTTAGTFAMFLDGSTVGLTTNGEDVDSIAMAPDGRTLISTLGSLNVPRTGGGSLGGRDEDILVLNLDGTFEHYFDGSDVDFAGEDIAGVWVDPDTDETYAPSTGGFSVPGLSGDADDVVTFTGMTGDPTSGTFATFFDGDDHGLGSEQLDGLHITFTPAADLSITKVDGADPSEAAEVLTYTIEVSNAGPDDATGVVVTDTLPAGLILLSTTGCDENPNGLTCSLGMIPSGASASYTLSATVDPAAFGSIENSASVTSDLFDPDLANNSVVESTTIVVLPNAVADGPAGNSEPGDPFHTPIDTLLVGLGLLDNDTLGHPVATLSSFGSGDVGGTVVDNLVDSTVSLGAGSLTVYIDGSFSFTPDTGFTGPFSFEYQLTNSAGTSDGTVIIFVGSRPIPQRSGTIYVSSTTAGVVDGVEFEDDDILVYESTTDMWSLFLDGGDVGLSNRDLNGFHIVNPHDPLPRVLLTLKNPVNFGALGVVDDSDIIEFSPTSLGETTAGTFQMYLDGSTVGLDKASEDIDVLATAPDGRLLISTEGTSSVPGAGGESLESSSGDLLALNADNTFEVFFDGSDLAGNLFAGWVDEKTAQVYVASRGGLDATGLVGDKDDIFTFLAPPADTASGQFGTFFDGDERRLPHEQIDGLHIVFRDPPTVNQAPEITSNGGGATASLSVQENLVSPGTLVWGSGVFGDTNDFLESGIAIDGSGNVHTIGFFTGTVDFDPSAAPLELTSAGSFDAFISKLDSSGELVWARSFGGVDDDRGSGVALDESGNVYATGYFRGIADFDPGAGVVELTSVGVEDVFVSKFDSDGALVWAQSFGGTDDDEGTGVAVDELGNVFVIEDFVIDVNATDPEGDVENGGLTFSLTTTVKGVDNDLFSIDSSKGTLTFKTSPDFETPGDNSGDNDYEVEVTVTDDGGSTDVQTLTISVTDVAD